VCGRVRAHARRRGGRRRAASPPPDTPPPPPTPSPHLALFVAADDDRPEGDLLAPGAHLSHARDLHDALGKLFGLVPAAAAAAAAAVAAAAAAGGAAAAAAAAAGAGGRGVLGGLGLGDEFIRVDGADDGHAGPDGGGGAAEGARRGERPGGGRPRRSHLEGRVHAGGGERAREALASSATRAGGPRAGRAGRGVTQPPARRRPPRTTPSAATRDGCAHTHTTNGSASPLPPDRTSSPAHAARSWPRAASAVAVAPTTAGAK